MGENTQRFPQHHINKQWRSRHEPQLTVVPETSLFNTAAAAGGGASSLTKTPTALLADGFNDQRWPLSVLAWLVSLRIPTDDARVYAEALLALGFDDLQSLQEDATEEDLHQADMKPGHVRRTYKALRALSNAPLAGTTPLIPVVEVVDTTATDCVVSQSNAAADGIEIEGSTLSRRNIPRITSNHKSNNCHALAPSTTWSSYDEEAKTDDMNGKLFTKAADEDERESKGPLSETELDQVAGLAVSRTTNRNVCDASYATCDGATNPRSVRRNDGGIDMGAHRTLPHSWAPSSNGQGINTDLRVEKHLGLHEEKSPVMVRSHWSTTTPVPTQARSAAAAATAAATAAAGMLVSRWGMPVQREKGLSSLSRNDNTGSRGGICKALLPKTPQNRDHDDNVDARAYSSMPILSRGQRSALRLCRSMSGGGCSGGGRYPAGGMSGMSGEDLQGDRAVSPLDAQICEDLELVTSSGESSADSGNSSVGQTFSCGHGNDPQLFNSQNRMLRPDRQVKVLANAAEKESKEEEESSTSGTLMRTPILVTNVGKGRAASFFQGGRKRDISPARTRMERSFSFPRSITKSSASFGAANLGCRHGRASLFGRGHPTTLQSIRGTTWRSETCAKRANSTSVGMKMEKNATDDSSSPRQSRRLPSVTDAAANLVTAMAVEVQEEDIDLSMDMDLSDLQHFNSNDQIKNTLDNAGEPGRATTTVAMLRGLARAGEGGERKRETFASPAAEVPEEMGLSVMVHDKNSVVDLDDADVVLSKSQKSMDTTSTDFGGGRGQWGGAHTRLAAPPCSGSSEGSGINGLSLELSIPAHLPVDQSYNFSESGRLEIQGFVLSQDGMKSTPTPTPNRRDRLSSGGDRSYSSGISSPEKGRSIARPPSLQMTFPSDEHHPCSRESSFGGGGMGDAGSGAARGTWRGGCVSYGAGAESLPPPPSTTTTPRRMSETTILLEEIGRGGGGTVHKALHVPSMRLVAVKMMEVHDDEKRRQLITELKALNSMIRTPLARTPRSDCLSGGKGQEGCSFRWEDEGNPAERSSEDEDSPKTWAESSWASSLGDSELSGSVKKNKDNNGGCADGSEEPPTLLPPAPGISERPTVAYSGGTTSTTTVTPPSHESSDYVASAPSSTAGTPSSLAGTPSLPQARQPSSTAISNARDDATRDGSYRGDAVNIVTTPGVLLPRTLESRPESSWGFPPGSRSSGGSSGVTVSRGMATGRAIGNHLVFAAANETTPVLTSDSAAGSQQHKRQHRRRSSSGSTFPVTNHLPMVAFHDAYTETERGCVCMVMEYMDGGTLQQFVSRGEQLSEPALAAVARSVLRGLADMHSKHQIHRDIKPSNILLDRHGRIKISDFGVVRELTGTGSVAKTFTGTLTYMSPERITQSDYSYPSDIWSLGLAIVALAHGKFPLSTRGGFFEMVQAIANDPVPTLSPNSFSTELCDFVNLMLKRDPAERPTARAMLRHAFLVKHHNCRKLIGLVKVLPATRPQVQALLKKVVDYHMDDSLNGHGSFPHNAVRSPSFAAGAASSGSGWGNQRPSLPTLRKADITVLAAQLQVTRTELVEEYDHMRAKAEQSWIGGNTLLSRPRRRGSGTSTFSGYGGGSLGVVPPTPSRRLHSKQSTVPTSSPCHQDLRAVTSISPFRRQADSTPSTARQNFTGSRSDSKQGGGGSFGSARAGPPSSASSSSRSRLSAFEPPPTTPCTRVSSVGSTGSLGQLAFLSLKVDPAAESERRRVPATGSRSGHPYGRARSFVGTSSDLCGRDDGDAAWASGRSVDEGSRRSSRIDRSA